MNGMSAYQRRYLPVSYDLAGKRVAVVGDGPAARAKLDLLARTQAEIIHFPSPPDDLPPVALLFLAEADERLAGLATARGIPVNVVDQPALSTFAMPSIVERGPVTVAIASDGAAPVLAQRVRALVDALLPPALANLGDLARMIRSTVLDRLPGSTSRRRFWWRTFNGQAGAAALSGNLDRARTLALLDLESEDTPGKVFVVPAPEAADLLTLRAQRLLLTADVIVHDAGIGPDLLAIGRRDASLVPATDETLLVRLARTGQHVVRLVSGSPVAEIETLRRAGIAIEIVPGVAAASPSSSIAV